jgi:RNA polymerase sigma factor (sigma-70 family)
MSSKSPKCVPFPRVGGLVGLADSVSDEELVRAVLDGDVDAFSSLYRTHVGAVRAVISLNVHDPENMADLVQEVFTRALERLPTLRQPDRFRPWLLAITRNAAIDQRRQRGRVDQLDDDTVEAMPADQKGPDETVELAELARLVNGCVAGLSRRDATVVALVTHLGYSLADVAAVVGASPQAAKVIVHRARRRLRDTLSLQLLVRRRSSGCAELQGLLDADLIVAAARHVRTCDPCADAAEHEVQLYDGLRTPNPT